MSSAGLEPDQKIGPYRVVRELGRGGMGAVYLAIREDMAIRVAIKTLTGDSCANQGLLDRFFREPLAANAIDDPGVVRIHDKGQTDDGTVYLVMEYLNGQTLKARIAAGLTTDAALRLSRQIASTLVAAHRLQIVHRDLKPENIMIIRDPETPGGERTKILDFGIAKLVSGPGLTVDSATQSGQYMGTPAYMAPEQCGRAGTATDRADVYALGVLLYQMLTGRLPFYSNLPLEIMLKHVQELPPDIREVTPSIPLDLAKLVMSMLEKHPESRPTMRQVAASLEQIRVREVSGEGMGTSQPNSQPPVENPPSSQSTLGSAAGERKAPVWPQRRHLVAAAVIGLCTLGAAGYSARRFLRGPEPGVPQPVVQVPPPPAPSPPEPELTPPPAPPPVTPIQNVSLAELQQSCQLKNDKACRSLDQACRRKEAGACYRLGNAYSDQKPRAYNAMVRAYSSACHQHDLDGCKGLDALGSARLNVDRSDGQSLYKRACGVDPKGGKLSTDEEMRRFQAGCDKNLGGCCYLAGVRWAKVAQWTKAHEQWRKGCASGNARCCNNEGTDFRDGRVGARDVTTALEKFQKARRDWMGQINLGCLLLEEGKDKKEGLALVQRACQQPAARQQNDVRCDLRSVEATGRCKTTSMVAAGGS